MNTSDTSGTSHFDNISQLDNAQKDERTRLAVAVGFFCFAIPLVILFIGLAILSFGFLSQVISEKLLAANKPQADGSIFRWLGLLIVPSVLIFVGFAIWVTWSALKKHKQLRVLCGNTWSTSPWRSLMWSSWFSMNLCLFAIVTLSGIVSIWTMDGFIGVVLNQTGSTYISAGILALLAIMLFGLWRIEQPLGQDLLLWATPKAIKGFRESWASLILIQGMNWLFYAFGWEAATKTTQSLLNRVVLSAIMCAIALCGILFQQRRLAHLRAAGKVMDDSPTSKAAATLDPNQALNIWDTAKLAQIHSLSLDEAEKEARSNLAAATGCAISVWLAVGLSVGVIAACVALGVSAVQANRALALSVAKTFGIVAVVGAVAHKPATQLFSLYRELRTRTQDNWPAFWRIRLLYYITGSLILILTFVFSALQLPLVAFALPACLIAIDIVLDIHGIQTARQWGTHRRYKQTWQDLVLTSIVLVIGIPLLARFSRAGAITLEGLAALWQTLQHNPVWGLPDVWLMVIVSVCMVIEVWLCLRQTRPIPNQTGA